MAKRKESEGFGMSFLDLISCGLGAAILILILVKFQSNSSIPTNEVEQLQQELNAKTDSVNDAERAIEEVNELIAMETVTLEQLKQRIDQLQLDQGSLESALDDKRAVVANLQTSIAAVEAKTADDATKLKGRGQENYLLGLKVEGKNIAILIDSSASMADYTLLGAIRKKTAPASERRRSSKWRRTVRITQWLLARLPKESNVTLITFNKQATVLGNQPIVSGKLDQQVSALAAEIEKVTPDQGTNLAVALRTAQQTMPGLTDMYIVTDGLPTLADKNSELSGFSRCGSFFGKSSSISGECRQNLFHNTIRTAAPKGVKTNVILLSLEGDPMAPFEYWNWAAATNGTFISPARTWP